MSKETTHFSEGNWIVHRNYGVGQIQGTEDVLGVFGAL
jgi:transcription elongation factor GreA-like protein